MSTVQLKDPDIIPTDEVLAGVLGDVYPVYHDLTETITAEPYSLTPEWRYYNDGKAWLCKVTNKKKTVFWLSIWDTYAQTGFYFTEKHLEGIAALPISESIKEEFAKSEKVGKLIPLILQITSKDQLPDLFEIIRYKKSLK